MKSYSEIDTTVKRASKAIGFSWGVSEEIGKSIRLLEMLGIAGVKNLNSYFKVYKNQKFQNISLISNKVNKLQAEDTHTSLFSFKKKGLSCTVNMSTAFRPRDFEASIKIYCKEKIINLAGLCCNTVSVDKLSLIHI